MHASRRVSSGQDWKQLYQAALLELDPDQLPRRIINARHAVMERTLALLYQGLDDDPEFNLLVNVAGVLDGLAMLTRTSGIPNRLCRAYGSDPWSDPQTLG